MILEININTQAVALVCEKCGHRVTVDAKTMDTVAALKSVSVAILGLYRMKAAFCTHVKADLDTESMNLSITG